LERLGNNVSKRYQISLEVADGCRVHAVVIPVGEDNITNVTKDGGGVSYAVWSAFSNI